MTSTNAHISKQITQIGFYTFSLLLCLTLSGCEFIHKIKIGPEAQEYSTAWRSRDVDAIVSMHAEDSVFHIHFANEPAHSGKVQIKEALNNFFKAFPDYQADTQSIHFGTDFITGKFLVSATPTEPFVLGNQRFYPSGKIIEMEIIDLIIFKGGKVTAKHTYMDVGALLENTLKVENVR